MSRFCISFFSKFNLVTTTLLLAKCRMRVNVHSFKVVADTHLSSGFVSSNSQEARHLYLQRILQWYLPNKHSEILPWNFHSKFGREASAVWHCFITFEMESGAGKAWKGGFSRPMFIWTICCYCFDAQNSLLHLCVVYWSYCFVLVMMVVVITIFNI